MHDAKIVIDEITFSHGLHGNIIIFKGLEKPFGIKRKNIRHLIKFLEAVDETTDKEFPKWKITDRGMKEHTDKSYKVLQNTNSRLQREVE